MGSQDMLAVAELQGYLPPQLVVWGAQSESIEMCMSMTTAVAAAMEQVIDGVVQELADWDAAPELVT